MDISNSALDGGRPFDGGRTAADHARCRDIYPPVFYAAIAIPEKY